MAGSDSEIEHRCALLACGFLQGSRHGCDNGSTSMTQFTVRELRLRSVRSHSRGHSPGERIRIALVLRSFCSAQSRSKILGQPGEKLFIPIRLGSLGYLDLRCD
jgi:hypothetical protein